MDPLANQCSPSSDSNCLTQSQLMLWMGQQINPESPLYNMALAFDLQGAIQVDAFQAAFELLLQASDAMRTVFTIEEEEPVQQILAEFNYSLPLLDWSAESDESVEQKLAHRSQQLFDLSSRLFDTVLIKRSEDRYIWYLNQHHLITDAWAVTVLYKEMAALYQKALDGKLEAAPAMPPFKNYLAYEQTARNKPTAAQKYWQEKIKQLPEWPHFYGHRELTMESRSQRLRLDLGVERSNQLRALTKEVDLRSWTQHLSLFNIFASTLFAFMYRVSGQQKLAIGTPAHNRSTPEFKATPGVFIEVFPITTIIEEGESFGSLVQKVRNEAHQFLRYAQTGSSSPDLSRGFNAVLNYINAAFEDFNDIPMQSNWIHPEHCDPGHHLRLQVHDFDASGSIQLYFDLNEVVFPAQIREQVAEQFLQLLDAFIEDRSQVIGKIGLLSKTALEQTTVQFNQQSTFDFKDHSVLDLFEEQAATQADTIAIRFGQQQISYQELNEKANQLARQLAAYGVQAEDRVALHLTRSPELLMGILAAFKLGATYIPIPSNYPKGRVADLVEDANAKILLSGSALKANLPDTQIPTLLLDKEVSLHSFDKNNLDQDRSLDQLAYIMYTSGSTGKPKGVMINHRSLSHYIQWASQKYTAFGKPIVPLFSSIGFDLTVTSLFIPLVSGGCSVIYEEALEEPDLAVFKVVEDNLVNFIKLTPAHLSLLKGMDLSDSRIRTMIVGGEDLKAHLAQDIHQTFGGSLQIYNEYGPTEATVGSIVQLFDPAIHLKNSVPIGVPLSNTQAYVLDEFLHPVPVGIPGELYLSGIGLAQGYWQQQELTEAQFIAHPFRPSERMYRTGDLVYFNLEGGLTYLGRKDQQVKIRGRRIELGEIEEALGRYSKIKDCVVDLRERQQQSVEEHNCVSCGLPSNYPGVRFDEEGVCHLCNSFESYQEKVSEYFKAPKDLQILFDEARKKQQGEYDCLMLLSGGKDSTYALGQLTEMGLKVLTFTLDNGYISEQAKANVRRVTKELGVDHIFGETPAMNEIFVDSLQRHQNVCDGCFKTIYTLSMKIALEKNIPYIITGLSRGQFFETRLTEELFNSEKIDVNEIDELILNARKAYHRVDDAVKRLLDVSVFEDDAVFEKVRFLDFYRYTDVSLEEMYVYLDQRLPWSRPTDTGRSTNCLINQAGIFVHKKEKGYSNYAFPYSWDVRIGHKTREDSLDEINEVIDEQEVERMLREIGYLEGQEETAEKLLVAYYVSEAEINEAELSQHLSTLLPEYMIPVQFIRMEQLPLTTNGKIDREALPKPDAVRPRLAMEYVAPRNDIESMLTEIWSEVLHIDQIGVFDKFLHLGGHSLTAIRLTARINEALELDLPLNLIFQKPTIAAYAEEVEATIEQLLTEMNDSQTES